MKLQEQCLISGGGEAPKKDRGGYTRCEMMVVEVEVDVEVDVEVWSLRTLRAEPSWARYTTV
jgi:hypothetical protein